MLKASGCEFMLLTLLVHFKTIKYSCFVHLTLVSTSHKCVLDAGWLSKQSECSSCWHIDNNRNIPVKDYSAEQISRKFLTIWRVIFFYVYKLGYAENEFNILATFHLEIQEYRQSDLSNTKDMLYLYFTSFYIVISATVWKLRKFTLTHFSQKFRESNVCTIR